MKEPSFVPVMERVGADTYRVKSVQLLRRVSVPNACRIFGLDDCTFYRAIKAGFITAIRPSPRKILMDMESVEAFIKSSQDEEWWTEERRNRWKASL